MKGLMEGQANNIDSSKCLIYGNLIVAALLLAIAQDALSKLPSNSDVLNWRRIMFNALARHDEWKRSGFDCTCRIVRTCSLPLDNPKILCELMRS
jgi:hypothetical protein